MAVQRGIITSQDLRPSGRQFVVDDGVEHPCYLDRYGRWWCGHDHDGEEELIPLQECYQWTPGWTAQVQ